MYQVFQEDFDDKWYFMDDLFTGTVFGPFDSSKLAIEYHNEYMENNIEEYKKD